MQRIYIYLQGYKCTYTVFLQNLQTYSATRKTSCCSYIATKFLEDLPTRGTFSTNDQIKVPKDNIHPSI